MKVYIQGYFRFIFFFFQAEDGIRDHCVTGVQTCALPICTNIKLYGGELRYAIVPGGAAMPAIGVRGSYTKLTGVAQLDFDTKGLDLSISKRSEERRVGKEGRSRWSPYQ